ncbi:MAG: hypothetical protein J0L74_13580, partial [Burkholderiales bacterium]|nr:hypothetical protein [Burkholderiales bacterium]
NPCQVVLAQGDNGCAAAWEAISAALGEAGGAWLQRADAAGLQDGNTPVAALMFEGDGDALLQVGALVAAREGALVRVESRSSDELAAGHGYDLAALVHEQSISTNTAAAGGNAQLMTMA